MRFGAVAKWQGNCLQNSYTAVRIRSAPPSNFSDKEKFDGTKASVKNRDKRFSERSA
jgi:hypothetical protein